MSERARPWKRATYRLRETHQAVERHRVGSEVVGLLRSDTEGVLVQGETGDCNIVGDDVALNSARAVGDRELLASVDEGRGRLGTKELVVTLITE